MQNKTTQILALLSPEEIKLLDKWLASPWCNSNKKLYTLFVLMKKHHPSYDHASLTKPRLFRKIYPGKAFDDKFMRNLLSGLTKEVERFLQHQRLSLSPILGQRLLVEEYQRRNDIEGFEKKISALIKVLEEKPKKDLQDLYDLASLYKKWYREPSLQDRNLPGDTILQKANHWLDQFYGLAKSRFLAELTERQLVLSEDYNLEPIVNYLSILSEAPGDGFRLPAIKFYLDYYQHREVLDSDVLTTMVEGYFRGVDQMVEEDQTIALMLLINKGIRSYAKGDLSIRSEIFKLYKLGLEYDLLLLDGRLSEFTFTNIVSVALSQKEFDFVKSFVENNYKRLPDDLQEDGKVWGLANLMYEADGKIDSDLEKVLAQRKKDYTSFYFRTKNLLLNNYFDYYLAYPEEDYDFFLDYTYAFEKAIRRNDAFSEKQLASFRISVQLKRKLFLLFKEINLESVAVVRLRQLVEEEKFLFDRRWLLQKIEILSTL